MRHLALYRKYRPKLFSDVIGQRYVVNALKNQIITGKIGHALLFTGTRGTGKTTCAKIFAKAVNCLDPKNGEPCLECEICRGIENESVYDVVEMDAASNNGVDSIRDILSEVNYLPVMAKYRVYIIDEVHMLSQGAFNALLKTLEEPPQHVIFILATTEIHKVPATILSRCQRYDFTKLDMADIADSLLNIAKNEGIDLTVGGARLIASLADGAMRDANSILETCAALDSTVTEEVVANIAGITRDDELFDFADKLILKDTAEAMMMLMTLSKRSVDYRRLGESLVEHFSDLLMAGVRNSSAQLVGVSDEKFNKLRAQSRRVDSGFVIDAIDAFSKALESTSKGRNPKVALETAIFGLCNSEMSQTVSRPASVSRPVRKPAVRPVAQASDNSTEQKSDAAAPAGDKPAKEEKKEPVQDVRPAQKTSAAREKAEDRPVPFKPWDDVIKAIEKVDFPLHTLIKNSEAYLFENIVYIKGNESFYEYIRENREVNGIIKDAIRKVCGRYYNIGGYRNIAARFETEELSSLEKIKSLERFGVKVNIKE